MVDEASSRDGVTHACGLGHLLALKEELQVAFNLISQSKVVVQLVLSDLDH